jgi:hypothetical protein
MFELELLFIGGHFGLTVGFPSLGQVRLTLFDVGLGGLDLPRTAGQSIRQVGMLPVDAVEGAERFGQCGHAAIIQKNEQAAWLAR